MDGAKLFLWRDGALFLGPLSDTAPHRHHAAQICVGFDRRNFRLQLDQPNWSDATFAFLPSNIVHRFDSQDALCAIILVDGESSLGQCRRTPLLLNEAPPIAPPQSVAEAQDLAKNLATHLGVDHPHPQNPRIGKALTHIESLETKAIAVKEVADIAALSESRFQHLFSQEVGIPFRRYLLWRRLNDAVAELLKGADLTMAAHMGGFSDSAHFSRTFKETFGLAPSMVFKNSRNVQVLVEHRP